VLTIALSLQTWYEATVEVQKKLQQLDPDDQKAGYLTRRHLEDLEKALKDKGFDVQAGEDPREDLINFVGAYKEGDKNWMSVNDFVAMKLGSGAAGGGFWTKYSDKLGFHNWVSVSLVLFSSVVKLIDILQFSDCGQPGIDHASEGRGGADVTKQVASEFELTEEILRVRWRRCSPCQLATSIAMPC